jgi:fumarate reductase subunit D
MGVDDEKKERLVIIMMMINNLYISKHSLKHHNNKIHWARAWVLIGCRVFEVFA